MFSFALIILIRFYQKFLSFDTGLLKSPVVFFLGATYAGKVCRHSPTCSEYAVQSIKKFGIAKGVTLTVKRILSCTPFN